jgi:hypothetical protein
LFSLLSDQTVVQWCLTKALPDIQCNLKKSMRREVRKMYIVNETKSNIRLPIKSTKQVVVLNAGEKSPELSDKLHNEVIGLVRAFGLTIEGYTSSQFGAVDRKHSSNVIKSDPKANSGDSRFKARTTEANEKALAKSKAVSNAALANKAASEKAANEKAASEKAASDKVANEKAASEKATEKQAESSVAPKATTTKATKKPTARTRRKPLARKAKATKDAK